MGGSCRVFSTVLERSFAQGKVLRRCFFFVVDLPRHLREASARRAAWDEQVKVIEQGLLATVSRFSVELVSGSRHCCGKMPGRDNDNDNDTLREVPHPSNEGLALQARV